MGVVKDVLECVVFIFEDLNFMFIDECGCRKLGILKIFFNKGNKMLWGEMEEIMIFGEIELRVRVEDFFMGNV